MGSASLSEASTRDHCNTSDIRDVEWVMDNRLISFDNPVLLPNTGQVTCTPASQEDSWQDRADKFLSPSPSPCTSPNRPLPMPQGPWTYAPMVTSQMPQQQHFGPTAATLLLTATQGPATHMALPQGTSWQFIQHSGGSVASFGTVSGALEGMAGSAGVVAPGSWSTLAKRPRAEGPDTDFLAYEKRYKEPAARCSSGACAQDCATPCELHTCKCCKKHRRMNKPGVPKEKQYCGMCTNQERVEALEFVVCRHEKVVDGVTVECGIEMLKGAFHFHWKQHRTGLAPKSEVLAENAGRRCGTCTNMRPLSFYPKTDSNCSCYHCQNLKGSKNATRPINRPLRATSGSTSSSAPLTSGGEFDMATGTARQVRRRTSSGAASSPKENDVISYPTDSPVSIQQLSALRLRGPRQSDPSTPSPTFQSAGAGSSFGNNPSPNMNHSGTPMSAAGPMVSMLAETPARPPAQALMRSQTQPASAAVFAPHKSNLFLSLPPDRSSSQPNMAITPSMTGQQPISRVDMLAADMGVPGLNPPRQLDVEARAARSAGMLGAAVTDCPTFRLLLGQWAESRQQPGPAADAVHASLSLLIGAIRDTDQLVAGLSQQRWQELLARGNALMGDA